LPIEWRKHWLALRSARALAASQLRALSQTLKKELDKLSAAAEASAKKLKAAEGKKGGADKLEVTLARDVARVHQR
jgi:hypothetical protein